MAANEGGVGSWGARSRLLGRVSTGWVGPWFTILKPLPALLTHVEGARYWGSRLSAKWTRPSYQDFSGNGVSVASMCAALHQCPPSGGEEGGGFGGDLAVLSIGT